MSIMRMKDYLSKHQTICFTICLYLLLYFSQESLLTLTRMSYFGGLVVSIAICLLYFIMYASKELLLKKKNILVWALLLFLIIIFGVVSRGNIQNADIYIAIVIFLSCLLIMVTPFTIFTKAFVNSIVFISICSLIFTFLLRTPIFDNPHIFSTIRNPSDIHFFDCKLAFIVQNITYLRNFGIFREPGVFQIMITFAVFFELFFNVIKNKAKYLKIIILFITVLSTFSVPGILQCTLLLMIFMWLSVTKIDDAVKKKKVIITYCSIIGIVICAFIGITLFNDGIRLYMLEALSKLLNPKIAFDNRFNAIIYNLNVGVHNIFFGDGFAAVTSYKGFNTSTTTALFAMHGIVFFLFSIYATFNLAKMANLNKIFTLTLTIILIITLNTQLLNLSIVIWMIQFYAIEDTNLLHKWRLFYEKNHSISA